MHSPTTSSKTHFAQRPFLHSLLARNSHAAPPSTKGLGSMPREEKWMLVSTHNICSTPDFRMLATKSVWKEEKKRNWASPHWMIQTSSPLVYISPLCSSQGPTPEGKPMSGAGLFIEWDLCFWGNVDFSYRQEMSTVGAWSLCIKWKSGVGGRNLEHEI